MIRQTANYWFQNFSVNKFRRFLTTKQSNVDSQEIEHFEKLAQTWWDIKGPVKALHQMNYCRIPYILNELNKIKTVNLNSTKPLNGFNFLDVGCGGGILTEGLNRLGCNIIGLDASEELIKMADYHGKKENLTNLKYVHSTIQDFACNNREKFDVVVSSETIEHVTEKKDFLQNSLKCLKSGGSLFITTPNKTWLSKFYIILFAENIAKVIPKGTHTYDMFIHLNDLQEILIKENCKIVNSSGIVYDFFHEKWLLTKYDKMWYFLHAIKC